MSNVLRTNVDGVQAKIVCMNMLALENKLEKGQKNGDATKVITSGEISEMNVLMPSIDTKVTTHEVKSTKEMETRRKLQKAIIREQTASREDIGR